MADLSGGAYGDVVEHALAAAALTTRSSKYLGIAAPAATYAGDLDQARRLNSRMVAAAVSPTLCAFGAYVDGEIANAAGRTHRADEHYARAIDLAHSSGATFVIGIASVGRLTVKANAGHVADALRGYRDLIDYWHRSGNWTQQWVTLRNLAQLLRRLGDNQPAALLDAAAEPGAGRTRDQRPRGPTRGQHTATRPTATPHRQQGPRPRNSPTGHP